MSKLVEQILDLARWAPSGDNTQPWRFEILDAHHFVIHGFDTAEDCIYDLKGFGSQLAQGALLETIRIAASSVGFRVEDFRRQDSKKARPIFDVRLYPDKNIQADVLLPFVKQRCTQRRSLRTKLLTIEEKKELLESVGNSHEMIWKEGWRERWAMAKLLFSSAGIRLSIPEAYSVHREVIEWNVTNSVDRIPDAAIGLDPLTLKLMRWAMQSWERVDFLNKYFAGHFLPRIELDLLPALRCASHFFLKSNTQLQSIDENVNAGRAVQRFWLTATKLGLQLQPEMTPMIFARYAQQGISLSQVKSAEQQVKKIAAELERLTDRQSASIVFMGRVGHGAFPQARSTRLSLEDLMH